MADLTALNGSTEMTGALPSQFVGQPNLTALWSALGQPISDAEAAVIWLQTAFTIADGTGVQLDHIGDLLGQPRVGGDHPNGESDADYRVKLYAAVLRNRSMGTAEDLRAMVKALLTGLSPVVQIVDLPPAAFGLAAWVSAPPSASTIQALIDFCDAAKSAGVGIAALAWYTAPTFAFDGYPDPPFQGYDDGTGTVGGYWANYIFP